MALALVLLSSTQQQAKCAETKSEHFNEASKSLNDITAAFRKENLTANTAPQRCITNLKFAAREALTLQKQHNLPRNELGDLFVLSLNSQALFNLKCNKATTYKPLKLDGDYPVVIKCLSSVPAVFRDAFALNKLVSNKRGIVSFLPGMNISKSLTKAVDMLTGQGECSNNLSD